MKNQKIAYVVTPENFGTWCIYYFAKKTATGSESARLSGYGKEELKKHITKNDTVLITGKANISFLMLSNNLDVSGYESEYDTNYKNAEYIMEYIKNGAISVNIF